MKQALYIGRFNPFHKGHHDVIRYIDSSVDIEGIIIGIGSAQYNHESKSPAASWLKNPFTYEERKDMLETTLCESLRKPYQILPLPDYHNYGKWFNHIRNNFPEFCCLYSNDKKDKEFFEAKGIEVRNFPKIYDFHATDIRNMMLKGENYEVALPKGTIEICRKINTKERMKKLAEKDLVELVRLDLIKGLK